MDEKTGGFSFTTAPTFTIGKQGGPEPEKNAASLLKDLGDNDKKSTVVRAKDQKKNDEDFVRLGTFSLLASPWRQLKWTEEQKTTLMKSVGSYQPGCPDTSETRVLLLGPVGSGKSSFISSVQSVFNGRVINRAMVGSFSTSFTKKLQFFRIHGLRRQHPGGLVLCDTMGLGDGAMTGPSLHDVLSIIEGFVPEGHKFSPDQTVNAAQTLGYVKKPSLGQRIHCVVFVLDASKVSTYPKSLNSSFQQLREHISDLGVHQVAVLTHVDRVCSEIARDLTQVYSSRGMLDVLNKASALLGMSTSYIVPVKNYSSELEVNVNTDVLLLSAVDHILQYADLYFQDNWSPNHEDV